MDETFPCKIIAADAMKFDGSVRSITFPTRTGEMQALPNHAEAFIRLTEGDIIIRPQTGKPVTFRVEGGTLRIKDNSATVVI